MKQNNPQKCQLIMFSGKGGVGKTTSAAATALHHSSLGQRTLIISTDATPSLSHIFEIQNGQKPAKVRDALHVAELGVEEVREMWDRKFGKEVYAVFSAIVAIEYEDFVAFMTSLLPGLFDEFMVDYIRELGLSNKYDVIIWDTAPLGQTLTLLETPSMLKEHLRMAPRIYSRLKAGRDSREPIINIIRRWQKLSTENIAFLRNEVGFTLVTIPEALAVNQLEGVFCELDRYGIKVQQLIINNVVKAEGSAFLTSKAAQQKKYLDAIHDKYQNLTLVEVPLFPYEIKGLERLGEVAGKLFPEHATAI
ncbi:MAG: ArsA family ATPase [Dehalococcoidia bacterium]|nr:MAG: ArsA family ATPase [Dehalococcoidia bacterium]